MLKGSRHWEHTIFINVFTQQWIPKIHEAKADRIEKRNSATIIV